MRHEFISHQKTVTEEKVTDISGYIYIVWYWLMCMSVCLSMAEK